MLLSEFLINRTLESVEILPDQRLINVLVDGGQLFGVMVDNIPLGALLTKIDQVELINNIIHAGDLVFDTNNYTML